MRSTRQSLNVRERVCYDLDISDDIITQWQLLALVVGPALAVVTVTAVWRLRHTIAQQTRRDDRQDLRKDQMAVENGALSDRLVETEKMLLTVLQKHEALQKQVDTGFSRFEKDVDRVAGQLTSAVADLRMSISTAPNEYAEMIERLRARIDAEDTDKQRD